VDAVPGPTASFLDAAVLVAQAPLSLSMAVGADDAGELGDGVPDDDAVGPEEDALRNVLVDETRQVLRAVLTDRERAVLTQHFGLDGAAPATLDVVSRSLGVTRERVRQVEVLALRKLRHSRGAARLGSPAVWGDTADSADEPLCTARKH